jgi:hypothetical protein
MDQSAKSSQYEKWQISLNDRLQAHSNIDHVKELLRPIGRISADAENDKSAQIANCKRVTIWKLPMCNLNKATWKHLKQIQIGSMIF